MKPEVVKAPVSDTTPMKEQEKNGHREFRFIENRERVSL
jgi:hypothetical protein